MATFGTFSDAGESDNVTLVDGIDPTKKNSVSVNGDAGTADGLSGGGVNDAITLTTANTAYEAKVGASRLPNRKSLTIVPGAKVFWGYSSSVTVANGTPLIKDQPLIFAINPNSSTFQVWLVASTNSVSVSITESP
jgi:hypothetical protein